MAFRGNASVAFISASLLHFLATRLLIEELAFRALGFNMARLVAGSDGVFFCCLSIYARLRRAQSLAAKLDWAHSRLIRHPSRAAARAAQSAGRFSHRAKGRGR